MWPSRLQRLGHFNSSALKRLSVASSNRAAIRLYESFGFNAWAIDTEALKVGDVYHHETLMRRDTVS